MTKAALKTRSASKPRRSSQFKLHDSSSAQRDLRDAAKKLFARRGLSGTSIRDIAKEAELNSSLISYYFGGKEGLYRACVKDIGERRLVATQEILRPPKTATEFTASLHRFIENLFELFLSDRDAGLILVREYDRMHSPAEQIFSETFLKIFDLIVQFFAGAQKKGLVQNDKDPFVLASLLFGTITSQMRLDHLKEKVYGKTMHNPAERNKIENHIIELFKK